MFEFVVCDERLVLDPRFVGVDGVDRVFEDARDLLGVVDAHTDQSKDAQVGVEELVFP